MSQVGFVFLCNPKENEPPVRRMVSEGDEFTLEEMQGAVKGLIEHLPIPSQHDLDIWVNEEGNLIKSCKTNHFFLSYFADVIRESGVLLGPKLVAGDVLVIETEGLIDHHMDGRFHKILVRLSADHSISRYDRIYPAKVQIDLLGIDRRTGTRTFEEE